MSFSGEYIKVCIEICHSIDSDEIEKMASLINSIRSLKKDLTLSPIEDGWNIILILEYID